MNWISRKLYLYNVIMGLYVLDWWERYLFNALTLVLLWFFCYNGFQFTTQFYNSYLKSSPFFGGKVLIDPDVAP